MAYVLFSLLLFCASVITHVSFCRSKQPPSGLQVKAFVMIAIIFMGVYLMVIYLTGQGYVLDPQSLWGLPFKITAGIIYVLLIPFYLSFYVLTQLTSPSKKILLTIAQAGEVSFAEILASVQKEDFITTRLSDLCASGCVTEVNGRHILTSEGQKIASVLNVMQGVLGRNEGG